MKRKCAKARRKTSGYCVIRILINVVKCWERTRFPVTHRCACSEVEDFINMLQLFFNKELYYLLFSVALCIWVFLHTDIFNKYTRCYFDAEVHNRQHKNDIATRKKNNAKYINSAALSLHIHIPRIVYILFSWKTWFSILYCNVKSARKVKRMGAIFGGSLSCWEAVRKYWDVLVNIVIAKPRSPWLRQCSCTSLARENSVNV